MIDFFIKHMKNSKVIGIEPHPININLLTSKFKGIKDIDIIHGAINTEDGICNIGLEQQERIGGLKQGHILNQTHHDMQLRDWNNKLNNIPCWKLENVCKNGTIIKWISKDLNTKY